MNARTKQVATGASSVAVIGLVVAGVFAFGASASPSTEPTPTPTSSVVIDLTPPVSADRTADEVERARVAAEVEAARIAAEAEAARVAAEQAAQAEADRIAAEQAAQNNQGGSSNDGGQQTTPSAPQAPAPVRCPGGSSATESDGTNDTACMWDICWSLTIPDAAHPECDTAFRP